LSWWIGLNAALRTGSEILAAGISVTAFALLLYAFTFNLRDRVARSFILILSCVVVVFTADALGSTATSTENITLWLKIQWLGILYLPPTYMQFSDAVLATTGKPSKGKRSFAIKLTYAASTVFLLLMAFGYLLGPLAMSSKPAEYLSRTVFTDLFTLYYIMTMVASWTNFTRAYRRTTSHTARRRLFYLITGALAPALGSYPYLLYGSTFAAQHTTLFWFVVLLSNLLVGGLIVMMSYSIAFFGVDWPDRVVKRRLFKWILRGPVTGIAALGVTTLVKKGGILLGIDYASLIPILMILTILLMEYTVTMISPLLERWLFNNIDQQEIDLLTDFGDRLMTHNDLRQFLEAVLSAISDRFQSKNTFIAALTTGTLNMVVSQGDMQAFEGQTLNESILPAVIDQENKLDLYHWGDFLLMPVFDSRSSEQNLLGIIGFQQKADQEIDEDEKKILTRLSDRIALALINRKLQEDVFDRAKELTPQFEQIQKMLLDSRFPSIDQLTQTELRTPGELSDLVKDALTHYWGGPKLANSPLLKLNIVKKGLADPNANPINSLRNILRSAIEKVKPDGERRMTGEWILYNILDMKFLQGKKVREVALKLSMSEADLYRKQRIAIEAVAKEIMEMENKE